MPGDRPGRLVDFGGRRVYFPPFVHQPPSLCTMTSALMAANVARVGMLPATQAEVKALAADSGHGLPPDGYSTRDMMRALGKRYGLAVDNETVSLDGWRSRLSNGWVGVLAVRFPRMPEQFTRRAPSFTGGHRIVIAGYRPKKDTTLVIDPLAPTGAEAGQEVEIGTLYPAMEDWVAWQVWLKEAEAVLTTLVIRLRFDPPRTATLRGDGQRRFKLWNESRPGLPERVLRPPADLTLEVDAKGQFRQGDDDLEPSGGPFMRIAGGEHDGLWLRAGANIEVDLSAEREEGGLVDDRFEEGFAAGIASERASWNQWLGGAPAEVAVGAGRGSRRRARGTGDDGIGEGLDG